MPEDLRKTYGAFATAMVEGDAERAVELYAEDAVVLVDHEHVYRGRQAIREGFLADHLEVASRADEDGPGTEIRVDRAVVGEGVVTLAGRNANPSGAAGVYSNSWERQADGSRKLSASVLTLESSDRTPAKSSGGFACTQVLGFSQSMEWYAGLSVVDHRAGGTRPDLSALAPDAFLPAWQGRYFMGAALEEWRDPEYPGWSGHHRRAHETPAHCGRDEVDRVVFNVSGTARSPDGWATAVDSVADVIRTKFPAVRRIVMQPVVGAPEGTCEDVRAARNHPVIAEGIRRAAKRAGVAAGPEPKIAGCDQFSDAFGHLTVEGAEHVRRTLREHYRPSATALERDGPSSELIVYTTLRPANQDVYLVERSGAAPRRVTANPGLDYNATFSPDGRWLVFTSERKGNADLYALDLEERGEAVRLTYHPAMDDAADVSPDGERLVFVSTRDGNAEVFTMPFAPGDSTVDANAENLTRRPAGDFNPAFSPDGSMVAWARQDARPADEPVMSPQNAVRTMATRIFVMGSDGSGTRPVMEEAGDGDGHPPGRMVAGSPAWSPDGRSLYVHGIPFGRDGLLAQLRGQSTRSGIWRIDLSGGPPERVVGLEEAFALSPSVGPGGRVAYATGPPPPPGPAPLLWHRAGEVRSSAPDGTGARVEVDSTHVPLCLAPAFGPDGRLACHGPGPASGTPRMANGRPFSRPGTDRLARLGDRRVRVLGIRGIFPDVLSDGRLLYGEWLNEATDLAQFAGDGPPPLACSRLDGTGRREVFRRDQLHPWAPAACNDGRWIAFTVGTPFAAGSEDVDIWKVRPDGTGAVNLTSDSDANDALPTWSPDCRRIYFRSFRDGDGDIYSMDPEGEDVRRVTDWEGVETAPDISPDGEWIAFATDRDDAGRKIWIQRLDGSDGRYLEPERVGSPGIDMHPRFSPDGAWVVFVSDRGGFADEWLLSDDPQPYGDIWAVPAEGGEAVRLTDDKWEDGLAQWGSSGRR